MCPPALRYCWKNCRALPWASAAAPIIAAGSLAVVVPGLNTHTRVLLAASMLACTYGSCHFQRPSCGAPHMPLASTPPNWASPAVIAPFSHVDDG